MLMGSAKRKNSNIRPICRACTSITGGCLAQDGLSGRCTELSARCGKPMPMLPVQPPQPMPILHVRHNPDAHLPVQPPVVFHPRCDLYPPKNKLGGAPMWGLLTFWTTPVSACIFTCSFGTWGGRGKTPWTTPCLQGLPGPLTRSPYMKGPLDTRLDR